MWRGGTCVLMRPLPSFSTRPERPRLGHREIHARQARIRLEELLAKHLAGHGGKLVHVLGVLRVLDLLAELAGDLILVLVDGGHDDVARRFAIQLDDVLAQIGLQGLDAMPLEEVIEVHLLRDHALALTRVLAPLERRMPRISSLASSQVSAQWTWMPFSVALASNCSSSSGRFRRLRDRMAVLRSRRSCRSRGVRELRQALGNETVHGPAEVRPELRIQQSLGGGIAEDNLVLNVHGCAPEELGHVLDAPADCA